MALYVGRETETAQLMQLRRKKTSSLVVCQGRRRIGKSTFIRRCGQKLDHFLAFEGLPPREGLAQRHQLGAFAEQLAAQTPAPKVALEGWPQAFALLNTVIPRSGWTLVLIDEVSWLSIGDPDFAGHLKAAWDNQLSAHPRLILVLCGSVSSWIERNILASPGFVGRCSLTIKLDPLELRHCNAFWRGKPVSPAEKLKILAVTGGVPRYLEEIDPSQSAEQNIYRLCFEPGGFLFREVDQIFHDVFDRRAETYREVVTTLVDGARTVSEIGAALQQGRGGSLSAGLEELALAGFVCRDVSFSSKTGQARPRAIRYRLADNFLRFYLKYVAPRRAQIEKRLFRHGPLENLLSWDIVLGLQLENLVLGSFQTLRSRMQLDQVAILNAGPYTQLQSRRRKGCQIDLLVRTKQSVHVVEVKFRRKIDRSVIDEVKQKVARLEGARGLSVRTSLVYVGELDPTIEDEDYFDSIIPFADLLEPSP